MGTRASFWIGNPEDLEHREWLGGVSWDGYPEGFERLSKIPVETEKDMRNFVRSLQDRKDFADPAKGGWPWPWDDDIFLTDYTYAFFRGKLRITCYHCGWRTYKQWQKKHDWSDESNLPDNVLAPRKYDARQPDSIIILQVPK